MRHPVAVMAGGARLRRRTGVPGAAAVGRGPEHRVAALTLAALLFVGGAHGQLNLFVDGVLRDGAAAAGSTARRWRLCMAAAPPLAAGGGSAAARPSAWSCSAT